MAASRSSRELLAALAVAVIAFFAPREDTGFLLRTISALFALLVLFAASVGLELLHEYKESTAQKKSNRFEIQTKRVELPTSPPGGVYAAASAMVEHLQGFEITMKTDIKPTENGFQVTDGTARLRARVVPGHAVGFEAGGPAWEQARDAWVQAAKAAPRVRAAKASEWHGVAAAARSDKAELHKEGFADKSADEAPVEVGDVVRLGGLQSKPELNGKCGAVVKAANEAGRYGVRLEGTKDPMSLHGRNLTPFLPMENLGVSIACLRSFAAAFQPLSAGLTVAQAVNCLLCPLTESSGLSLAATLHDQGAADEAGRPLAAKASLFAIAADSENFDELLVTIEAHVAKAEKPEEVYIWLDIFSLSTHASSVFDRPMSWWNHSFKKTLKEIGSAVLLLQPWEDPRVCARAWPLFQLWCALNCEVAVAPVHSPAANERLHEQLLSDMDKITSAWDRMLEGGWRRSIEAPKAEQKERIERAIDRSEGGAEEFAARFTSCLHRWLLGRAKAALETLGQEERATSKLLDRVATLLQEHGELEAAEPLCREQVEGRKKKLGEKHPDTLEAVNNLALLLHQLGKLGEAEPYSRAKLAGCRAQLGDHHPDTVTAIDTLSQLLSDNGKLEEALPLKRESLAVKRKVLGDRHPDTLLSVNNLAVLLNDLGRAKGSSKMLREAEPLKREALAGCREVLGNRHPHTLASIGNLADMLMQLAHIDPRALIEAEPLCREAVAGSREVLGEGHPDTLKSIGNLAALLVDQAHQHPKGHPTATAKLKEAVPLFRAAVDGFAAGLGTTHPTVLSYVSELARTLVDLGEGSKAEALQKEAVSSCRATLGDAHPETLISITHLAGLLRNQNKAAEAEPLCREVLSGWRKIEEGSEVPRNTLTAINILAELLHSQGKDSEAEPLCREVLGGFLRALGAEHPFTVSAAENLAGVLRSLGKETEAEKIQRKFPQPKGAPRGAEGRGANGSKVGAGLNGVDCPVDECEQDELD